MAQPDFRDPDAWRIFNERADIAHRQFETGELSADLYRAKLYTLGFRGAAIESEVNLHAPLVASPDLTSAFLFNCCTDERQPDWSPFLSIEVGGCIAGDGGETTGGVPDDQAEFWTVYARRRDGCAEAITDTETRELAEFAARTIARLSGLPLL